VGGEAYSKGSKGRGWGEKQNHANRQENTMCGMRIEKNIKNRK
jgi:hypothetical protein